MKMLLTVKNNVNIARYMGEEGTLDSGMSTNSISTVELGVIGVGEENGFLGSMYTYQKMFRELVGDFWDNRTLIRRRHCHAETPMRKAYVHFNPTMENVAQAIFLRMKPFIDAAFEHANLAYVRVYTPMGAVNYYNEELIV